MPKRGTGDRERRDKSDSGKKRSARTRFIVITTKTRYATICSDVQRCGFSAHRSRSQYATRQDNVTTGASRESAVNTLRLLRRDGVEKREREREERSNARRLIDHATAYRPFVAHLPRERRRYALLGTLPTASDKDPCAGYGRTRWLDTRASL